MKTLGERDVVKDYYEESIYVQLCWIQDIRAESKEFQKMREKHSKEPEVVMLLREKLFNNAQEITFLRKRIEDEKSYIKKLG